MLSISLTWNITSKFIDSDAKNILDKFGCTDEKPKDKYQQWLYKGVGVTIIRFEKKLSVQGKENKDSLKLIRNLSRLNGLSLDTENAAKFVKLFKVSHNAIFCMECQTQTMLIEGKIDELDLVFRKECGHIDNMHPPLFMLTNRILPDINILIGGHLSNCINLTYFEGFEVVIPDLVMHVIDILDAKSKSGASNEITKLRELEKTGKISIFNCKDGISMPAIEEFQQKEDDLILDVANLTNSILFTGDMNLKDKAVLNKRPTIYIHPKESKNIKIIEEVRNP